MFENKYHYNDSSAADERIKRTMSALDFPDNTQVKTVQILQLQSPQKGVKSGQKVMYHLWYNVPFLVH